MTQHTLNQDDLTFHNPDPEFQGAIQKWFQMLVLELTSIQRTFH